MVGACPRRVAEKRCSSGCRVTWGRGGYKRAGEHTYRALTFWLKREPRRAYGPQAKGETTALVCGGGEALAAAPAAVAATAQVSTYTVQSTSAFGHFSLRAISTCHEVFLNTHLEMHELHSLWRGSLHRSVAGHSPVLLSTLPTPPGITSLMSASAHPAAAAALPS